MGEGKNQNFKDHHHQNQRWAVMEESDEHEQQHPCSSIEETSTISNRSSSTCSSFDTTDDASSSPYSSSPNSSRSSLYDLSDLMSHLPIKRGLSKFYHGKSDSFTSLARVTSIEDLPKKKKNPYQKMKASSYKSHTLPKPIISKKTTRGYSKKKFGQVPSAFSTSKQLMATSQTHGGSHEQGTR